MLIPSCFIIMKAFSSEAIANGAMPKDYDTLVALAAVTAAESSKKISSLSDATKEGLEAVESLVEAVALSSSSTTEDVVMQNRDIIQQILRTNRSSWGSYSTMKSINGTLLANYTGREAVDVTQNVLRIEDFREEASESVDKTDAGSLKEKSETRRQNEVTDDEKLNIVLFYADDWTMKVLGALNPDVHTPNIDNMAKNGMLFKRNCVTTSICWISRNTLATGLYSAVHKTLKIANDNMFNKTVPWLETLYPLLKRNGYFTGLVGKWHAPTPREFMTKTFDVFESYFGSHWMKRGGQKRHVTDLNGQHALRFLKKRPKNKKFSLTVSFFATHAEDGNIKEPYQPMPESMNLYANTTIPRPKTATQEHWDRMPWFFDHRNEGRRRWKHRFDTDDNYQEKIKNMYRMATEVDAVVGAVIEELKEQGIYNKTLLVFTTDNGNLQGEHGLAEKWYPFEESVRVPLVIQDPRMPKSVQGTHNDDFTLSVDLAPTLLRAAGIEPPKFMQGRDMAQLYLDPVEAKRTWRQDFFYEWTQGNPVNSVGHNAYFHIPAVYALIRKDYKYFYWPQVKYEQLFHIEKDAFEENDLLNSTAQTTPQALHMMRARYAFLKTWAQSGNPV